MSLTASAQEATTLSIRARIVQHAACLVPRKLPDGRGDAGAGAGYHERDPCDNIDYRLSGAIARLIPRAILRVRGRERSTTSPSPSCGCARCFRSRGRWPAPSARSCSRRTASSRRSPAGATASRSGGCSSAHGACSRTSSSRPTSTSRASRRSGRSASRCAGASRAPTRSRSRAPIVASCGWALEQRADQRAPANLPDGGATLRRLEQLVHDARRMKRSFAVIYVDVEPLRTAGPADAVRDAVARRLRREVRANDHLGHLGGDAYLALLALESGESEAYPAAQRLLRAAAHAAADACANVGVAICPDDGVLPEDLVEKAGAAAMAAASVGGARPYWFRESAGRELGRAGRDPRAAARRRPGACCSRSASSRSSTRTPARRARSAPRPPGATPSRLLGDAARIPHRRARSRGARGARALDDRLGGGRAPHVALRRASSSTSTSRSRRRPMR